MITNPVTTQSTTLAGLGAGSTSDLTGALGKEEFLKLLTAQLQHQDPLQPVQNEAFVAELAQFSSLEQMQNVNSNLATSLLLNQSVNNSLATTLIGREVEAAGNDFTLAQGGNANLSFHLDGDATAKVEVVDGSGKVVATLEPGSLKAGDQSVTWDGKGADGQPAPPGQYTFRVTATDAKGNPVAAHTLIRGRVTGVQFEDGATYLLVGSRKLSLSDVTQILEAPTSGA